MVPALRSLSFWSSHNLITLALWLAAIAGLLFGLIASPWRDGKAIAASGPRTQSGAVNTPQLSIRWAGRWLLALGLLLAGGEILYTWSGRPETIALQILWTVSILSFVLGCWAWTPTTGTGEERAMFMSTPPLQPEQSWPYLFLILAVAALLFTWQLGAVPLQVDGDTASHGLQALKIASGREMRLFAPGWANIPLLAYAPAAMGMIWSGDPLVGNRLAGVSAGLLTLLGIWLLGCELFRRPPRYSENGELLEDDGRWIALLATGFTTIGYTFIHFSRLPEYMEPVAWGTLALWALYRGVRRHDRLALGLSGLLVGLAAVLYYSGRVFAVVALLWWIWFWLFRRAWLQHRQDGVGWGDFALWLGGAVIFAAPVLGSWLRSPTFMLLRLREVSIFGADQQIHTEGVYGVNGIGPILLENVRRSFLTFNLFSDTSTHFGWEGPMLDGLTGPLLILAAGFLILNLDRLVSWLLLSWMGAVLVLGGVLTINAPFWPRLLPVLPAVGLAIGLVIDRWRITLMESAGDWLGQVAVFLAVGLMVLAGVSNWVDYYSTVTVRGNPASYVGRAVRQLPPERVAVLLVGSVPDAARWEERVVRFLSAGTDSLRQAWEIRPDDWPAQLPEHSTVLIDPRDWELAREVKVRYPGGLPQVQRNRIGDPVLLLYQLP